MPLIFVSAQNFRKAPFFKDHPLPGERDIVVEDMLKQDGRGRYKVSQNIWMTFDFLVGSRSLVLPPELTFYSEQLLSKVDEELNIESADYQTDFDLEDIDLDFGHS